ncbi:hypothetical protein FRZ06_13715 [Anoxybacterium hadale]|uniref:Uncharacterized protein n=1 Tax=Anoxybacterium hadale TaxID=3408580 RepID=A0ACD1AD72_9FIRM|nr:hypothetical protein FRZ06_13715 [Clostridiales bacterium]
MDFVNSAVAGAIGGSFGYGASRLGGNMYKSGIFDNMSRNAQRSFMRSNFNIRTNISDSSQNNSIANYYSKNSWLIGGFSELFSNTGTEIGYNYMPGINSYLYNSWNRGYMNYRYPYRYYR